MQVTYRFTAKQLFSFALLAALCGAASFNALPARWMPASVAAQSNTPINKEKKKMELGNFSVSLTVKDIEASKVFYEKLGFTVFTGNQAQHWLIMKNGDTVIGLFQGLFDKNILTFNPGWNGNAQKLETFTDVRELQRQLKARGIKLLKEADEKTTGPASLMLLDPDGNTILLDQHV